MKNTERFSDRVEDYNRFRPHYPPEIIPFLIQQIGLDPKWTIADIGSGTGISSELFLQHGNRVYAVEPNRKMREMAEAIFTGNHNFFSIDATAEETSLPDQSIDMILAGQAFHWFNHQRSKLEFQRIARPGARLVLMWNERKGESPFQQSYEQMLIELAPAYETVCQHNIVETAIQTFFSPHTYSQHVFPNVQFFDLEGLKGRLLSSSYAPLEPHPSYPLIMQRLERIFNQFSMNGKIAFEYSCKLFYGKI